MVNSNINISESALKKIMLHEAFSSKPYMPTPKDRPTIGYGSTFYENGKAVKMTDSPITKERAEGLFRWWVSQKCETPLRKLVSVPLNQNQWDALCSLIYNIGETNFATSSVRKHLNNGDYQKAADSFLSWVYQKGKVLRGLQIRRREERALFLS